VVVVDLDIGLANIHNLFHMSLRKREKKLLSSRVCAHRHAMWLSNINQAKATYIKNNFAFPSKPTARVELAAFRYTLVKV
jgi:hypothetical protein